MKRVLITGSNGFVGGYLAEFAASKGITVMGFDRTAGPERKNIVPLEGNLEVPKTIRDAIKKSSPKIIFHLAAQSSSNRSWDNPPETFSANVVGTINLLEAVKEHSPKARFIFASSSECYGAVSEKNMPIKETEKRRPLSPYGLSKKFGEDACQFYANCHGLDIKIARFFNIVGPKQRDDFVVSNWTKQIAEIEQKKKGVLRVGCTDSWRDFLDVRDGIKALWEIGTTNTKGRVFNICSGHPVKLEDILKKVLGFAKIPVSHEVDRTKIRKVDIKKYYGSNARLCKETRWKQQIPLEISILDTLEYWRSHEE